MDERVTGSGTPTRPVVGLLGRRVVARHRREHTPDDLAGGVSDRRRPKRMSNITRLARARRPAGAAVVGPAAAGVEAERPEGVSDFGFRWMFGDGVAEGVPFAGGAALRALADNPAGDQSGSGTIPRPPAPPPRGRVDEVPQYRLSRTPPPADRIPPFEGSSPVEEYPDGPALPRTAAHVTEVTPGVPVPGRMPVTETFAARPGGRPARSTEAPPLSNRRPGDSPDVSAPPAPAVPAGGETHPDAAGPTPRTTSGRTAAPTSRVKVTPRPGADTAVTTADALPAPPRLSMKRKRPAEPPSRPASPALHGDAGATAVELTPPPAADVAADAPPAAPRSGTKRTARASSGNPPAAPKGARRASGGSQAGTTAATPTALTRRTTGTPADARRVSGKAAAKKSKSAAARRSGAPDATPAKPRTAKKPK